MYSCLSETDIAFAIINYPYCEPRDDRLYKMALQVAGVEDENLLLELLKHWKEKDYTKMRYTFSMWNLGKQSKLAEQLRNTIGAEMEKYEKEERDKIAKELDPQTRLVAEYSLKQRLKEYANSVCWNTVARLAKARTTSVEKIVAAKRTWW